jgi:hypothetical protein
MEIVGAGVIGVTGTEVVDPLPPPHAINEIAAAITDASFKYLIQVPLFSMQYCRFIDRAISS